MLLSEHIKGDSKTAIVNFHYVFTCISISVFLQIFDGLPGEKRGLMKEFCTLIFFSPNINGCCLIWNQSYKKQKGDLLKQKICIKIYAWYNNHNLSHTKFIQNVRSRPKQNIFEIWSKYYNHCAGPNCQQTRSCFLHKYFALLELRQTIYLEIESKKRRSRTFSSASGQNNFAEWVRPIENTRLETYLVRYWDLAMWFSN